MRVNIVKDLFLRQSPDAGNANGLPFASGDVFVAASANQHRAAKRPVHPPARLVRLMNYFICFFRQIIFHIILFNKGERLALLVAPAGPADAMHIIVVCLGNVIIDDMADVGYVQTSRGHIGGH